MNLLAAKLYDPAVAVTKATSALLAMTALDTTNLRLAITVPAHGMVRFRLAGCIHGATTFPSVLLGVLNGSTVIGRVAPEQSLGNTAVATALVQVLAEFIVTGLTPGAMNVDAAYGVETVVAATGIKYGGPNNTTVNDAFGGFVFEAWDPQPQTANSVLAVDASGRVDVGKVLGTAQTAGDLKASIAAVQADADDIQTRLPAALVSGRIDASVGAMAAGVLTATAIAADAITDAKVASDVTIASVTGAVGSVTGNVGGNVTGSVGSVTAAVSVTGDLSATMKTSVTTAATAATPIAASVSGAVGSVTGNVGGNVNGNVVGSVASVTAAVSVTGDLSATMKTSVTTAATAATPTAAAVTGAVGSVTGAVGSVTGNVGGNVNGNVVGSVASVTAAVSVTGDLTATMKTSVTTAATAATPIAASVTGNVGGNVVGTVASVVGAVGSVTGNVGGNVTGSVGSVTGLTASDVGAIKSKTDNLPSDPADQSLIIVATDAIMTRIGVAGAGLTALGDARLGHLDEDVSSRLAAGDYVLAPTADENADALLARNVAGGSSIGRTVKQSLFVLRNRIENSGGTMTVYETDDTTPAFTASVTTAPGDPIAEINPT